jgi:hypothetical protein
MNSNVKGKARAGVQVELKYCEHCGGLWVRESGAETVYCENCQPKVAELPPPKKTPGRLTLPVRKAVVVEEYGGESNELVEVDGDELDFEAAGGVA